VCPLTSLFLGSLEAGIQSGAGKRRSHIRQLEALGYKVILEPAG
jgi:hypothetical protein